jgi:hypothetical protein
MAESRIQNHVNSSQANVTMVTRAQRLTSSRSQRPVGDAITERGRREAWADGRCNGSRSQRPACRPFFYYISLNTLNIKNLIK